MKKANNGIETAALHYQFNNYQMTLNQLVHYGIVGVSVRVCACHEITAQIVNQVRFR